MFKVLPHHMTLSVIAMGQDKRGARIATFPSQLTGNSRHAGRRRRVALAALSTVVAYLDRCSIANRWRTRLVQGGV
jgi:hypothetical protein